MQQIIHGDCRKVLKTFTDDSFHLIVTSPPYNVGINYGTYEDNLTKEEYFHFTESWLRECYRILVIGGRICINIPTYNFRGKFNMYIPYHELMTKIGFLDRDTFVWVKLDGLDFAHSAKVYGKIGPENPHTRYPYELILVMQKGCNTLQGEKIDVNYRNFFKFAYTVWFIRPEYDRTHPAPFPVEIPYRLITLFSFPGQKVIDPFCGGGATLRACKRLNREGTGIEIDLQFVRMSETIAVK